MPFKVVDQNILRRREVIEPEIEAAKRGGYLLVIPDLGIYEMTKTTEWESTLASSLHVCTAAPDTFAALTSLKFPTEHEAQTGEPDWNLIDWPVTSKFREMIRELAAGGGPVLDHLRATWSREQRRFGRVLSAEHQAKTMRAAADDVRPLLSKDDWNLLRNEPANVEFEALMYRLYRSPICRNMLVRLMGVDPVIAGRLAMSPSISTLRYFAYIAIVLRWVIKHGIDTATDAKLFNDYIDLEYIVPGVLSRGLVTLDKKSLRVMSNVKNALRVGRSGCITSPC